MKTNFIPDTWYGDNLIIDVDDTLFMLIEDVAPAPTPSNPGTPDDHAVAKMHQDNQA